MEVTQFLPHDRLDDLLIALRRNGYRCIGPQIRDGAIIFDILEHADQLPWGYIDHQAPGKYRLTKTNKKQAFAALLGPQAIKPELFVPRETLWRVERDENNKLTFRSMPAEQQAVAMIGVRPCDLVAMNIQDKVFREGKHKDPRYQARREKIFLIAANCTHSGEHCFCVSTGGYPRAFGYYDLAITELSSGFVVTVGSVKGKRVLSSLKLEAATYKQCQKARESIEKAANAQTKQLPVGNSGELRDILFQNLDHPRWDEVAERCLSCGNCTQVCPTCFCSSDKDNPDLSGKSSDHEREWDSCFTRGHSYIAGKVMRPNTKTRYRQWLTHKLGSWHDQFNTSGCVGCGRCITWCPVGIDITEEVAAITGQSNIKEG